MFGTVFRIILLAYLLIGLYIFLKVLSRQDSHEENGEAGEASDQKAIKLWFTEQSQPVEMQSVQGDLLKGYKIYHPDSKKWAVVVHGYQGSAKFMAHMCKAFYDLGFNVFAPDLLAHGASGGKYCAMGGYDGEDLARWTQNLEQEDKPESIFLIGGSMGATTVMNSLDKGIAPSVKAFIADSGYLELEDELAYQMEKMYNFPRNLFVPYLSLLSKIFLGYYFSEVNVTEALKSTKLPALILHGDKDEIVPLYNAEKAYNLLTSPKKLQIFENARHTEAFISQRKLYMNVVEEFLSEVI